MLSYKVILTLISLYLCYFVSEHEYFQISDAKWLKKKCSAIEDGYEYKNIVIDKKGVNYGDPDVECWHTCEYGEKCMLRLYHPTTYSFWVRIITAFIMSINFYILFDFSYYKKLIENIRDCMRY